MLGFSARVGALVWLVPAVLVVLVGNAVAASPPTRDQIFKAPQDRAPSEREVREYAQIVQVSEQEAARRLTVQQSANGLAYDMRMLLGDNYAGVWFDTATGDVRVGVMNDQDAQQVQGQLNARFEPGDASTERVSTTREDLEAVQEAITNDLVARERSFAWVAIDDTHNRVVIGMGTEASASDWRWAEEQKQRFASGAEAPATPGFPEPLQHAATDPEKPEVSLPPDNTSRVRQADVYLDRLDGSAVGEPAFCSGDDCERPLHGGVAIAPADVGAVCSAGFLGVWWSGWNFQPYLMTAGHCMNGNTNPWRAHDPGIGSSPTIGNINHWRFGSIFGTPTPAISRDLAVVNVHPFSWWASPLGNKMVMWGWSGPPYAWDNWPLQSQDIMVPGRFGCRSGISTNFTCGIQQYQSVNKPIDAGGGVTTWVDNSYNVPTACVHPGDSGGPFVDGPTALGIAYARDEGECTNTWFQHVYDMGYYFGVWVLTS